ncbi:tetratricopeptide repeat protein [Streptomyces sp. NPDC041003]|uniref:tetratricopeptide repeat protein n=1 Tax=Streptomyces sp. NPDC041003 TaxID=3155730 RepID=UPI0033EA44AE
MSIKADRGGSSQFVAGNLYQYLPAPPVAALKALPDAPDVLVGRGRLVEELLGILEPGGGPRAVVVAGLAGVGKSALALTVAQRALERGLFDGGVLYVGLRGYDPGGAAVNAGQAVDTLLGELGVQDADLPGTAQGRLALLRSELAERAEAGRRVLIVADDAGEVAQVRDLVPPGEAHRLLVTSRERLVVPEFRARVLALDELAHGAATELVADVLRRAWPQDPRPGREPEALAAIAEHCGRLPLALTVAAATLAGDPGLAIAELARQLADTRSRLDALSPADAGGLPTGVRAAFDHSYARLPADRARLLRLLTASPGPDIHTEFATVLGLVPGEEPDAELAVRATRALLAALARTGLLAEQPVGSNRWRMHDLVRLYATEQAHRHAGSDGREEAAHRVLSLYGAVLYGAHGRLQARTDIDEVERFPDAGSALRWLDMERTNLIAAVTLCAELGMADDAANFAAFLMGYLSRRRLFDAAIHLGRIGEEQARRSGDREAQHVVLHEIALALTEARRFDEAAELFERLVAFHAVGEPTMGRALVLLNSSSLWTLTGRLDEAAASLEEALRLFRTFGDRRREAEALGGLGTLLLSLRRVDESIAVLEEAVDLLGEHGTPLVTARALSNLGNALSAAGRFGDAIARYGRSLAMFRELDDWYGVAFAAGRLGVTLHEAGRPEEAVQPLTQAIEACRAGGERDGEAQGYLALGSVLTDTADHTGALQAFEQALALYHDLGNGTGLVTAMRALGTTYERLGDAAGAAEHLFFAGLLHSGEGMPAIRADEEGNRRKGRPGPWRRLRARFGRSSRGATPSPDPASPPPSSGRRDDPKETA